MDLSGVFLGLNTSPRGICLRMSSLLSFSEMSIEDVSFDVLLVLEYRKKKSVLERNVLQNFNFFNSFPFKFS